MPSSYVSPGARLWTRWELMATLEALGFFSPSSFTFVLSCCGISLSPSRFLIPGWHLADSPLKWNLRGTWFPICIFILGATSWIALRPVPWILLSHPADFTPDFQPAAHNSLYMMRACKCWLLIVATKDVFLVILRQNWDLGHFAVVPQCLHLEEPLL